MVTAVIVVMVVATVGYLIRFYLKNPEELRRDLRAIYEEFRSSQ